MAATKEVKVLARYTNKKTGVVSYLVRSSNGVDTYCTTVINGKASGCSCPAHKPCYHMKGLENKESARQAEWTAYKAELAKKLAKQYMTTQIVEQLAKMPDREIIPVRQLVEYTPPAYRQPLKNDMLNAALTKQGFQLMR